jgi:hypothetical protein
MRPALKGGRPPNDHADEIAELLASPILGLESLFDDPGVRGRIGERISQAMHRPIRRRRMQRVADEAAGVVKPRAQDR